MPPGVRVLAVDIPSGVDGDTGEVSGEALRADLTVTFAALKPGLLQGDGPVLAGQVEVADIGLDAARVRIWLIDDGDVRRLLPERPREAHKWQSGVVVVAGSPGMLGAASFCAKAAYRAGAGMVRLAVPGASGAEMPASEAVSLEVPRHGWASAVLEVAERCKAVVIGPGIRRDPETRVDVRAVAEKARVPVVVDADALFALGKADDVSEVARSRDADAGRLVLTPHSGEFSQMFGRPVGADKIGETVAASNASGCVVLLKGSTTVVADPEGDVRVVMSGGPNLATAGTGDVLSGAIGAFVARASDNSRRQRSEHTCTGAPPGSDRPRAWLPGTSLISLPAGCPWSCTRDWCAVIEASLRPAWAEIDLDAVRHNAGVMKRIAGPAALCAVVKADAYGHGAVAVARAAIEGGATWLGVAVVEEGVELREAGITAPVLVLSEPPPEAMAEAVGKGLVPTVYTRAGIEAADSAAGSVGRTAAPARSSGDATDRKVDVHLKVDTGMHRVGADPSEAVALAEAVCGSDNLRLGSVWTHLAVADGIGDEDRTFTSEQLRRYDEVLARLEKAGIAVPMRHAANSAGAIAHPASLYDMVRCGIAIYGELPAPELDPLLRASGETLLPAMSLKARVVLVRTLRAGERPSYGRRRALAEDSVVAVIPLGYADGVPRAWFERNGTVLVGGQHRPLAGTVTMDQIVIDCGAGSRVDVGDEVVLIGRQGEASLGASDWATVLGTISYEVLCGIGPRVTRVIVGEQGGDPKESMTSASSTSSTTSGGADKDKADSATRSANSTHSPSSKSATAGRSK